MVISPLAPEAHPIVPLYQPSLCQSLACARSPYQPSLSHITQHRFRQSLACVSLLYQHQQRVSTLWIVISYLSVRVRIRVHHGVAPTYYLGCSASASLNPIRRGQLGSCRCSSTHAACLACPGVAAAVDALPAAPVAPLPAIAWQHTALAVMIAVASGSIVAAATDCDTQQQTRKTPEKSSSQRLTQ
jgi:hypothetical protein